LPVHAVMGARWSSIRGRVLAGVGIGVPGRWVTPELADEVLAQTGEAVAGQRFRALPARLGVYFVLGLCLHAGKPYREVLKELSAGLSGPLAAAGWRVPASTALTAVRRRLGEKPFELLFWRLCGSLSPGTAPWSHICGLLAAAWDGTTVKAAASEPNIAAFGCPRGKRNGHYPQVRLVTLIACGTRALIGAAAGPARGARSGERTLAAGLLGQLREGMLLLADRGFYSYRLWQQAAARAHLLWRVQSTVHLPVITALPDGSWLSRLADPAASARRAQRNGKRRRRGSRLPPDTGPLPGITVRVIEFWLTLTTPDGRVRTEHYRLITTLLDHHTSPAAELAAGYAWRWAIETGFAEFKTYLRGAGRILRGRTPELARQELWAYLIIYQAIRAVICLAAATAGIDPDRISFTATLHAIRRTLTTARTSPDAALAETEASILAELIPQRDGRVAVRAVCQPVSPWPSKANHKEPISHHVHRAITIRPPHHPLDTKPDQAKPPASHRNEPP
jgi:Insertion element 4 transposase N-terminal/Transposase DDE domain